MSFMRSRIDVLMAEVGEELTYNELYFLTAHDNARADARRRALVDVGTEFAP